MTRVVALVLASALPLLSQQADFPINLRQGIMAGEVGETSAILQSRLTDSSPYQDPHWEGVRGIEGWAYFEIADNAEFRDTRKLDWMDASPFADFIVKIKASNLARATRYYYRLHYGPDKDNLRTSERASFRMLGGASTAEAYSFTIVTGMNYSAFHHTGGPRKETYQGPDKHLGYPALKSIRDLDPDFFVATGDNVYYDAPGHRGRAQTQHEMRKKHHEQYSQPRFLDLFRGVATYWLKDDHDHRFDDADAVNPVRIRQSKQLDYYPKTNLFEGESGSGFAPSHELGVRLFREQLPVVDPEANSPVTYRTHRVSRDLQVWIVEGRDYRSPLDQNDGPLKTIWGADQKTWLKRTLKESNATFKLLISATPMIGPDSADKRDNHADINGYRHEGEEFFHWLAENGISPDEFFITCGDRHWQYRAIRPDGYEEFSSGALVDANAIIGSFPGDPDTTDPEGKIKQPYHSPEPSGGFLIISVKPDGLAAVAEFRFYDEKGELLYEHSKRSR